MAYLLPFGGAIHGGGFILRAVDAGNAGAPDRRVTAELVDDAIREGAVLRVRPKAMTVAVILAGLLPILWGTGTGSEVMQRIAAPMVGGMITAPLLSMFVIPAAYVLMRGKRERQAWQLAFWRPRART